MPFFLCQMTNGSFSRTWIFNELLRSIDFIRIVRVKENFKICWKNCTSFNLLEWYRNANVFTTAIIQWKKNWAANTLVWWNRYSASADTSNLHMEMNCFPSWRFFFLRFFFVRQTKVRAMVWNYAPNVKPYKTSTTTKSQPNDNQGWKPLKWKLTTWHAGYYEMVPVFVWIHFFYPSLIEYVRTPLDDDEHG